MGSYDSSIEIRKLSPNYLAELFQILECDESWKILMAKIPKILEKDNYQCRIGVSNAPKYRTEDFRKIESASSRQRSSSEILFDEWGTSGRIRPSVGHLLFLLKSARLYKAADYVAVKLLNQEPVQRPITGPEAKVDTSLPSERFDSEVVLKLLDEIAYPSSIISEFEQHGNENYNLDSHPQHQIVVPKIVVSDTAAEARNMVLPRTKHSKEYRNVHFASEVSDMIKFSTVNDVLNGNAPNSSNITSESALSNTTTENTSEYSETTSLAEVSEVITGSQSAPDSNIPILSALHNPKPMHNSPGVSENGNVEETYSGIVPAFSKLLDSQIGAEITSDDGPKSITPNLHSNFIDTFESETSAAENVTSSSINTESLTSVYTSNTDNNQNSIHEGECTLSQLIPNLSILQNAERRVEVANAKVSFSDQGAIVQSSDNIPNFSELLNNADKENLSVTPGNQPIIDNSVHKSSKVQYQITDPSSNDSSIPIIIETDVSSNAATDISMKSGDSSDSNNMKTLNPQIPISRQSSCASPLPTLSLNTLLPHYNYYKLEATTDNFDDSVHRSAFLENANSCDTQNGRFLGSGAFGSVYLAIGLLDRPVAVKKLNLHNLNVVRVDDTVTKQFTTEVEVLSKFKHDNLLSLVGYSCDGPTYCLLYEYISGGALNDRLKIGNNLYWKTRLNIALGTAKAVSYLHTAQDKPLIHRDIKSANILLDCSNEPKLCDFGLIKLSSGNNTSTATTAIGTSAYMAPEAFRGDVSVKVDTYSLGVVILELLTGLPPLDETRDGCDIVTYIQSTCNNEILPLLDQKAGNWLSGYDNFGLKLFSIADRCLIGDKVQRPTTVDISAELTKINENILSLGE